MKRWKYPGFRAGLEFALCPSITRPQGGIIPDLSGNNHTGTFFGNTNVNTQQGKWSVDFPGTSDCIDIANTQNWTTSEGTLSVWVKTDSTAGDKYLIGRNRSGDNAGDIAIVLANLNPDKFRGLIQTGSGSRVCDANAAPNTTNWYHLLLKWDGSETSFWIDGVKQTDTDTGVSLSAHANDDFCWGWSSTAHSDSHGPEFNGKSDDLAAWNRALSDIEIVKLYQLGRGGWLRQKRVEIFRASVLENFEVSISGSGLIVAEMSATKAFQVEIFA